MKRVGADDKAFAFQLGTREHAALIQTLQAYPVVPPAHHVVSKGLKDAHLTEYQRLLGEALAEQRATNKRRLHEWLSAPGRFQKMKASYRFTLERSDSEWLLQVLNDVRVGHWLRLGSPESSGLRPHNLDPELLPAWLAMEISGYFQMSILEAIES